MRAFIVTLLVLCAAPHSAVAGDCTSADGDNTHHYSDGSVHAEGTCADGVKHGVWTIWYRGGTVQAATLYHEGQRHGPTAQWYPSGELRFRGSYIRGERDGVWTWWDEHARAELRAEYRAGRPDGSWTWWYPHSGAVQRTRFYFSGRMCNRVEYFDEGGNRISAVTRGAQGCDEAWTARGEDE